MNGHKNPNDSHNYHDENHDEHVNSSVFKLTELH